MMIKKIKEGQQSILKIAYYIFKQKCKHKIDDMQKHYKNIGKLFLRTTEAKSIRPERASVKEIL